ncbi:hypothetical protein PLICRDRAFT_386960 [Plicaturopsis crispa FD-325 SS-3]|nr:hypothetical protein PLICRDRAFT_386960 [Plicaturopsis crispa FD-325 SS-3]
MVRAVRNHITSSSTDEAQASTSGATTYKTSSEAPTTLQPKEKGSSVDELILSDIVKAPSKQADAPQHASESDEALDPAATQPIFTPHGKWAFAAGKDIEDVTRLALVGSGSSCEVYWKTGRIEGRSITYLSKM